MKPWIPLFLAALAAFSGGVSTGPSADQGPGVELRIRLPEGAVVEFVGVGAGRAPDRPAPAPVPPAPDPEPRPLPPPPPPRPTPDRPVDPAIRDAAARYFAGYVAMYRRAPARVTTGADYNEVTRGQLATREELGTTLGRAVDAVTRPLYDDQLKFKSPRDADRAYNLIADSLQAGIRDAALAPAGGRR